MPGCISRWKARRRWWGRLSIVAQSWCKLVSPFTIVVITFQSIAKKYFKCFIKPSKSSQAMFKDKNFFEIFHYYQESDWFSVSRKRTKFDGTVDFYTTYSKNVSGNSSIKKKSRFPSFSDEFLLLGFF